MAEGKEHKFRSFPVFPTLYVATEKKISMCNDWKSQISCQDILCLALRLL